MKKYLPVFKSSGFTLIELLVAVTIIAIVYSVVSLQITREPIFKVRDQIRKTDINALANTYTVKAIDKNFYEPLIPSDFYSGKIPTPPEGGNYQGLLTEPQEYFFICAQLEKGKDINCLLNSENPNCYCRKSHIGGGEVPTPAFSPSPSPTGVGTSSPGLSPTFSPTPTGIGFSLPTPSPTGIGFSSPGPSPTITPTPSVSNPPPVYSDICPYQSIPQTKPATVSLEGVDGSWCYDSDYSSSGSYSSTHTAGYCIDNNHNCADFCENNYPQDAVRDGYCTGNWWGAFWTNVHCEFGGYVCTSWNEACNEGGGQAYCDANAAPLPIPTPLPESMVAKRVFKTSTTYNGNLGGLAGADQKCQQRADTANLGGTWKAWLSDGTTSASQRLNHFNGPYKLLDGTQVVDDWADLTDGTLDRNINMTEFKVIDSNLSTVWTDTDISGNSRGKNCLNWTVSFGWPYYGNIGSGNSTLNYWTQGANSFECSSSFLALYCFEQ